MRAVTVIPGQPGSIALSELPEPPGEDGPVLVETQAIGICGTDLEIISGEYGAAPPSADRLVIGHESLGRVAEAPPGSGFSPGDLVVGIVRRRDPLPCAACAAGDWDMCTNGQYTERGIMGRHGYASERYRIHPEHLVAVDPALGTRGVLLEPATVVAKAWDHIEKIGRRSTWTPRKVLITGAGPIGLLAALLSVQRGYDTYVVDLVTEGRKPDMVRLWGAHYSPRGELGEVSAEADIVIECTGFAAMLLEAGQHDVHNRVTCLTGVSTAGEEQSVVDPRPAQPQHGAAQRGAVRLGQRQPAALRTGRPGTGRGRPGVAGRADHPAGAAGPVGRRLHPAARRHQDGTGVLRRRVRSMSGDGPASGDPAQAPLCEAADLAVVVRWERDGTGLRGQVLAENVGGRVCRWRASRRSPRWPGRYAAAHPDGGHAGVAVTRLCAAAAGPAGRRAGGLG